MNNHFYIISFILFFMGGITGCINKSIPPSNIYTISTEWNTNKKLPIQKQSSLIIKQVPIQAIRAFNSTDILYSDTQHSQNRYAYSRWSDAPVRLMQTRLQIALEESGLFKAVTPPSSNSISDVLLESTLFDFSHHINNDGTSDAIINMRFHLIDYTNKQIIATKVLSSKVRMSSKDAQGAASALNKAAGSIADKLISWLKVAHKF